MSDPSEWPDEIITLICRAVLADNHQQETPRFHLNLLTLNSRWHAAASRVLYESITLPDDNAFLLLATHSSTSDRRNSDMHHSPNIDASRTLQLPRLVYQLRAVLSDERYASSVKSVRIVPGRAGASTPAPTNALSTSPEEGTCTFDSVSSPKGGTAASSSSSSYDFSSYDFSSAVGELQEHTLARPLDAIALYNLIRTRLSSSLSEFTWSASRPPPDVVLEALSHCPQLCTFSAWLPAALPADGPAAGRRASEFVLTSPPLLCGSVAPHVHPENVGSFRWDATCLTLLPRGYLTTLSLSCLSQEGVRIITGLSSSLGSLEEAVFEKSLSIDDALLASLSQNCARSRKVAIRHVAGTKVTNKGISALMENSSALEALEFVEFEGRLTKRCWSEIHSIPSTFRSIQIAYAEKGLALHSWTVDHLQSIHSLIEKGANLQNVAITRLVPAEAEMPFQHDKVPLASIFQPKSLPEDILQAVIHRKGSVKSVDLTFWELDSAQLQILLEACSKLQKLSLMLDCPFSKVLAMTPTIATLPKLQLLHVCIPARHTTSYIDPSSLSISAILPASTDSNASSSTRSRQMSNYSTISAATSSSIVPKEAVPPLREIKKLGKRCVWLEKIEWLGRGAVGVWSFDRRKNAKDPKCTFNTVTDLKRDDMGLVEDDGYGDVKIDLEALLSSFSFDSMSGRGRSATHSSLNTSIFGFDDSRSTISSHTTSPRSPVCGLGLGLHAGIDLPATKSAGVYGEDTFERAMAPMSSTPTPTWTRSTSPRISRSSSVSGTVIGIDATAKVRVGKGRSASNADMTLLGVKTDDNGRVRILHGGGWTSKKVKTKSSSSSSKGGTYSHHANKHQIPSTEIATEENEIYDKTCDDPNPPKDADTSQFPALNSATGFTEKGTLASGIASTDKDKTKQKDKAKDKEKQRNVSRSPKKEVQVHSIDRQQAVGRKVVGLEKKLDCLNSNTAAHKGKGGN